MSINPLKIERVKKGDCMNAQEYMAYREEQEHIERKNRQSVQETALVSAVRPAKNVTTHKTRESTARGLIRATLKGYSELNAEIEKLQDSIYNYKVHAGVAKYGDTVVQVNQKHDISDTIVTIEESQSKFSRLILIEMWLYDALYHLQGLRFGDIMYIIEVYLQDRGEPSRGKTHRIIGIILEKGIELPTVEQAKLTVNENGRE